VAIFEQWGSSKAKSLPIEGVVMGVGSSEFTEINRSRAKAVKDRLERMGLSVTLGQAYEIVAVAHDHRNWPVMKSAAPLPATIPASVPATVKEPVFAVERIDQFIAQFRQFIDGRQKLFVPRNKALVIGSTAEDRQSFAKYAALGLDLEVLCVGEGGATASEIEDAFMASSRDRKLIFIDRVERLDVRKGGAVDILCHCLEKMPPGQFVVIGTERGVDVLPLSLLRRAQFRHNLN
jgi:hypothetical protein